MQYVADFTGDGWADVVNASFTNNPGIWLYVNPKGEARRWDRFRVVPAFNSEVAVLRDLDADGRPDLVYAAEGTVRFARPDPANPTAPWSIRVVSERGLATPHGIGAGDVNGDGRLDIVNPYGWWEQPAAPDARENWPYQRYWAHRDDYLDPDPYGPAVLYWYRTVRNPKAPGGAELVPELIHNQSGAGSDLLASDLNGDGRLDIVTATRFGTFIFWGRAARR